MNDKIVITDLKCMLYVQVYRGDTYLDWCYVEDRDLPMARYKAFQWASNVLSEADHHQLASTPRSISVPLSETTEPSE